MTKSTSSTRAERTPLTGSPTTPARQEQQSSRVPHKLVLAAVGLATVLLSVGLIRHSPMSFGVQLNVVEAEALCDSTAQSSGYIPLSNKKDGHYFYWFFESRAMPNTDPLVLWVSGGPGGSSLSALLNENGPCTLSSDGKSTIRNPHSWTSNANVIWVDQPIGSGFSYGATKDADYTEAQVGQNMVHFLQGWFKAHPSFANRPLFVTGGSLAGRFIPVIGSHILSAPIKDGQTKINLQGVAIGNGLVNPLIQMQHQATLLRDNAYRLELMTKYDFAAYEKNVSDITTLIEHCYKKDELACTQAAVMWGPKLISPLASVARVNLFDMRKDAAVLETENDAPSPREPLSKDLIKRIGNANIEAFLNRKDVQSRLHVNVERNIQWTNTASDVFLNFAGNFFNNYDYEVSYLLENNVRVLVYAGDADLVCNWKGNEAWTKALPWSGKEAFNAVEPVDFLVDGQARGLLRSTNNFSFLRLFNAGHLVSHDQPQVALTMINRFFANAPLNA